MNYTNWVTFYPLSFHRGCLFITYEIVALNKAVTVDTSAILQEKYKSYIYLRATPSDENENLTAGTYENFVAKVKLCHVFLLKPILQNIKD